MIFILNVEEISGAYVPAEIRADDAKLVAKCKDLNEIVGASITYVQPDGDTMKLNADVMEDWLVRDKSGELVKDDEKWDEKLWEFLERLAVNCNTIVLAAVVSLFANVNSVVTPIIDSAPTRTLRLKTSLCPVNSR